MTVESAADRLGFFDTDEFGLAATYTPSGGAGVAVSVILDRPDQDIDLGLSGVKLPIAIATLNGDELTQAPAKGDELDVTGIGVFVVRKASADADRTVWTLDLDPKP